MICDKDKIIISLQRQGLKTQLPGTRYRFRAFFFDDIIPFFVDTFSNPQSPFSYDSIFNIITLDSKVICHVEKLQRDNVVLAYERDSGNVLNINPNSRSKCRGCKFCYTTLEKGDDPTFKTIEDEYKSFFEHELKKLGKSDLSGYHTICSSTGCFGQEGLAVEHLKSIKKSSEYFGFKGKIQFLSSTIRTASVLSDLKDTLDNFQYTITFECLERRDYLLKNTKNSLSTNSFYNLIEQCRRTNIDVNFTYIVGLDSLISVENLCSHTKDLVTKFPIIQIFQPHNEKMRALISNDALIDEYYFETRRMYEDYYYSSSLRPNSWENYRSLWYYSFSGNKKNENRI